MWVVGRIAAPVCALARNDGGQRTQDVLRCEADLLHIFLHLFCIISIIHRPMEKENRKSKTGGGPWAAPGKGTRLQQNHPGVLAGADGLLIPHGGLHLADMGLAPHPAGRAGAPDFYILGASELPLRQGFAAQNAWTRHLARSWARPISAYSKITPASWQARMVSSSHTEACTSPIWALRPTRQAGRGPLIFTSSGQVNCPCGKVLLRKTLGRATWRGAGQGPYRLTAKSLRRPGRRGWSPHPTRRPAPRRYGPCPAGACTAGTGRCRRRW